MSKLTVEKVRSPEDRSLPVFSELDNLMNRVRERAHALFRDRGFDANMALDDWLSAEREFAVPAAELGETDKGFDVSVALAGFDPDDISVTASPRELIIKAAHESRREESDKDDDSKVHWTEFRSNDVYRSIALPASIDVDKVEAKFKHGMLHVEATKAKTQSSQSRQVPVSSVA